MEISCMGVRICLVYMLLFPLMIINLASSNLRGNEVERLSLLAFKSEIVSDPLGILSSWNDSSNLCDEWRGITCGRRHQRVTVLDLQSSHLMGILSPHIGNLSFLRTLNLQSNSFNHTIPQEIGRLSRLQVLHLGNNFFEGDIPKEISRCTTLISLHLNGNMLHGRIPESLSSLRQIQDFDLSRNNLSGTIPDYLQNFTFLLNLNLSFNDFEGEVGVFRNTSVVSIMGNTRICGGVPQLRLLNFISNRSNSNKPKSFSKYKPIIPFFCGTIGMIILGVCFVRLYRSRKERVEQRKARVQSTSERSLDISFLKLSYGDLFQATGGFSSWNLIGAGSSGSVFWGVLDQPKERIVAVKVLNLQNATTSNSFIAECQFLKNTRHRNLVKLVTACSSIDFQGNEFKALVFEYMMHGSLDEWLHDSADRVVELPIVEVHLNLIQRVNIAIDVASALDYLHNYFHTPIVHCDLKPSNVLLEKDMTACVCDFGLASYLPNTSCPVSSLERSSNSITGTIGYIPPEYGMGSKVDTYGDVYSYGILLLEMLTGKRPTDDMFTDDIDLHNFVLMALPERVKEIYDPVLLQEKERSTSTNPASNRNDVQNDETRRVEECLISIARIGVACSVHLPKARIEIGKVLAELRVIRDVLTGTRMPREHMITA
ncbi:putative protein kinase RLK-Pelle-LRR-XII-1 family [Rosa chinensis]|uniref:non-specific serine/threonine protein kinase n=2 Tax=Rosa chinensis TaxID=74649 RepID=A0A2P6SQA9_ROSCH|nr:putative protein kinase RLK-Pelle-LRR-XII-1 family [Rosa chinensis]